MYLHLFKITIYLWLWSIRGTAAFQFAFRSKLYGIIFEVTNCNLRYSDLVVQCALPQMGRRECCVTRPTTAAK